MKLNRKIKSKLLVKQKKEFFKTRKAILEACFLRSSRKIGLKKLNIRRNDEACQDTKLLLYKDNPRQTYDFIRANLRMNKFLRKITKEHLKDIKTTTLMKKYRRTENE